MKNREKIRLEVGKMADFEVRVNETERNREIKLISKLSSFKRKKSHLNLF